MFKKLQQKWKVSGLDLLLILLTFALGGSLCGLAGRRIMTFIGIEKGFTWVLLYVIILTIIWPLCVLLVSVFTGQFTFFKSYIGKMAARFSGSKRLPKSPQTELPSNNTVLTAHPTCDKNRPYNIAIFASGAGSNAQKLITHFKNHPWARVTLVVCNKPGAGVLSIAQREGIDTLLIEKERFLNGDGYVPGLQQHQVNLIILAGFLWKVPATLLSHYLGAVVNIHPALLPKYGGKGMYGNKVHEAVIANKESVSGISIHYVDELYDHGANIYQAYCPVEPAETPETLAAKVHALEHEHYPRVVEELINAKNTLNTNTPLSNQ